MHIFALITIHFSTCSVMDSHWFTYVSQSNHLAMPVDYDQELPWLLLQLKGTCNIQHTMFNDWFTGHLNYQIEHQYVYKLCIFHHI